MYLKKKIPYFLQDNQNLLLGAFILVIGERSFLLLHNSKNMHKLPIPPLELMEDGFAILTLLFLLFFFYISPRSNQIEKVFFTVLLLCGIDTLLLVVFPNSILSSLFTNPISSILHIALFMVWSLKIAVTINEKFQNSIVATILINIGIVSIYLNGILEKAQISFLLLSIGGTLISLISVLIFSSNSILIPYYDGNKSLPYIIRIFAVALFISFLLTILTLNNQVMLIIMTASLSQTLNIKIFREIPGFSFSFQALFLILTLSAIIFNIIAVWNLYSHYSKKNFVIWILILSSLGLEVSVPFINIIRVISVYQIAKNVHPEILKVKKSIT